MARKTQTPDEPFTIRAGTRDVVVSNPDKVLFPEAKHTKLDLVRYYLAVAGGALDRKSVV